MTGAYLYGFTDHTFRPSPDLRGLRDAAVRIVAFRDVAAIVSAHPVERLLPRRGNLEPHHRIVRQVSNETTLVPAGFGHISESEEQICAVLRGNYQPIRDELARLHDKCEMSIKLSWNVDNIFNFVVQHDRELRELRDRVFCGGDVSFADKIEVGGKFEGILIRERHRLSHLLTSAFRSVSAAITMSPVRAEKVICQAALLVPRAQADAFHEAVRRAACLFDANYTLEYSGPWPAYSFVQLRLQVPDTMPATQGV